MNTFVKDKQYFKFCAYGFLKNLRFYDAFILLFLLDNHISYSEIGVLYAAREIVGNLNEIPSGIIADTYGRKKALVFAFLIYILAYFTFYFAHSFQLFLIAMLLIGVGDAFRSGTHKGMIMDYLKRHHWENQKIAYYGHTRAWSQRGSAVSALIAGVLVLFTGNYRMVYLLAILPYGINFINIITYPKYLNFSLNKKEKKYRTLKGSVINLINGIKNKHTLQIMNSSAMHSAFLKAIKDYVQLVMIRVAFLIPILTTIDVKNKNALLIGVFYFFIYIISALASKNAFKFLELNIKNFAKSSLLLGLIIGILTGIFINYSLSVIAFISFVFIYVLENTRKPILTGFLADTVPNEILTSVLSAQSFYKTMLTAFLALLLGFLSDYFGVGIALLSISLGLILLTLWIGKNESKKKYL